MSPISIRLGSQTLDLHPERAAFWREQAAVLVADCHFGKAASFRHHGLAVPEGGTADDLARLDALIARTGARRLVVVGDLFHAPSGYGAAVVEALVGWRRAHPALAVALVAGNHDRALERLPASLGLDVVRDSLDEAGLGFIHDPGHLPAFGAPVINRPPAHICGHLHPAIRLGDRRVRGINAPCFWLQSGTVLVLPSFGTFTGHAVIVPSPGDRVFAVAAGRVVEVPGVLLGVDG